jgi:microsomal dipeptidase-like Zn-dependent dipeptidase
VIEACHRLGFVCDLAHATEDTVKQAVKVATKPLLLSHTALAGSHAMGPTPLRGRQVSRDHARAIAETGGSIGIWHFTRKVCRGAQRDGRRCRGRSRQHSTDQQVRCSLSLRCCAGVSHRKRPA